MHLKIYIKQTILAKVTNLMNKRPHKRIPRFILLNNDVYFLDPQHTFTSSCVFVIYMEKLERVQSSLREQNTGLILIIYY